MHYSVSTFLNFDPNILKMKS